MPAMTPAAPSKLPPCGTESRCDADEERSLFRIASFERDIKIACGIRRGRKPGRAAQSRQSDHERIARHRRKTRA